VKGINFISNPIFTRILSENEFGILSIYMSYEQIIIILATWEIYLGAYQKGVFKYKDDIDIFTTSTQCLINIITLIFFAFVVIFHKPIIRLTGMSSRILLLMFFYMMVMPSYRCWLIRKRTNYEYKPAVTVTILFSIISVIVPIIAILCTLRTAEIKIGYTLLASIIFCIIFYLPYANYHKLAENWNRVKMQWEYCVKYQGPMVLHALSYLVLSQADRIMISNMVGNTQAAFYSVAYSLAVAVTIVQNSIDQSLIPWRYQMMMEKKYGEIRRITNYLLCAIGALILVFILVAPEIMKILFTDNYYEAVWCIPPIAISVYFMAVYSNFAGVETYFEKTKYVMYVSVSCGILNIILNYACIGWFGYIACGYTTLISYVMFAIGHYYFMNKLCRAQIAGVQIFDVKIIIAISLTLVLLSIGVTFLYPYWLIRYGIVIVMLVLTLINKDRIYEIVKTLNK
jgi:O-antigen/teichoic acid export membrane protein